MKKIKWNINIDWSSKIIDLVIVITGITIAFQFNTWNESKKSDLKVKNYIESFYEENTANEDWCIGALNFAVSNKKNIETLKQILQTKNYTDKRIETLFTSMLEIASYTPSVITMENIKASGEFELIKDINLRKLIISTYDEHNTTLEMEGLLGGNIDNYVIPFFVENIRFSDFKLIDTDIFNTPIFDNIIYGYEVLLNQQIKGYQNNLEKIKMLTEKLNKYR